MRKYTTADLPEGSDALWGAHVAREYHGGMMTALYAMTSTGSLELREGDGLGPIIREVQEAIDCAERSGYWEDANDLRPFLAWLIEYDRKEA